ncbi:MAG: hypothetical protein U9P14_04925 [Gemmatimonadota bacterium]|nr:hypothetical protein [Gemmatimonadota bacterium]
MPGKLFSLAPRDEVEVDFQVRAGDEVFPIRHIFREPTVEDKKEYWSCMSRSELTGAGDQADRGGDFLSAMELIWERCVKSVEGYEVPDGGTDWHALIPLEHKAWAVNSLLSKAGTLSEAVQKN